jgi:CheY-like chemotaxis protein
MIMMRSLGNDFVVKEFPDGEPALEAIRQLVKAGTPPDAILLDNKMTKMDGLDVAQALKTDGIDLPTILATSTPEEVRDVATRHELKITVVDKDSPETIVHALKQALAAQDKPAQRGTGGASPSR